MKSISSTIFLTVFLLSNPSHAFAGCVGKGRADSLNLAYEMAIADAHGTCGNKTCRTGCWAKGEVVDSWLEDSDESSEVQASFQYRVGVSYGVRCICSF